ncbi:TPA: hypothetical protein M4243_002817 [Klebsiella variicola]|uniref:hypothetical protein n=1 Tax=Klebsiella variicola TaxID=244366 RepID=UPI000E3C72A5|nr:hypothetical protein [Klebsiella variicola]MDM9253088.1 hypothetical protein [Klebsiella variicola]HDK6429576.1 hypothetical protein [Klebsiella variicola]
MMKVPQPKSGELIDLLSGSLIQGKNLLSEFEVRRIISEARKLPERYQGLSIEGLLMIVCDELEQGYELLERALTLAPSDVVSWGNFSRAVGNKAIYGKQIDILKRAIDLRAPEIIKEALVVSAFWADLDLLSKAVVMARAMDLRLTGPAAAAISIYEKLIGFGDKANDIASVARAAMFVAEKHGLPSDVSRIDSIDDGTIAFSIVLNSSDPAYLITLNNELIDKMVEDGLENSTCVGFFEPGGE